MDKSRKYLELVCDICGDKYLQQERVYRKAKWKNRCSKHRYPNERKNSKPRRIYLCRVCGCEVSRGYDICKKCNGLLKRKPPRFCEICGVKITRLAKRCCLKCHNKNQNKGKTTERNKFNNSRKWQKVRKECFERDNYTCVDCGDKNYKDRGKTMELNAHHIKSWKKHPDLRLELNNLVTLCVPCHNKRHHHEGY